MTIIDKEKREEAYKITQAKMEEERKKVIDDVRIQIENLCTDEKGIKFLKLLYSMSMSPVGMVGFSTSETLFFREGRKSIYLSIRDLIPKEALIEIEIYK